MTREELEHIDGELFRELDLDEEQHLLGQRSTVVTSNYTPNPTGADYSYDLAYDWS